MFGNVLEKLTSSGHTADRGPRRLSANTRIPPWRADALVREYRVGGQECPPSVSALRNLTAISYNRILFYPPPEAKNSHDTENHQHPTQGKCQVGIIRITTRWGKHTCRIKDV